MQRYEEIKFQKASDFWEAFSPTRFIFPRHAEPIFRGQADAKWSLIPSFLRESELHRLFWKKATADELVTLELDSLISFTSYCDDIGIALPNDSIDFREQYLNLSSNQHYYHKPEQWPNEVLMELMAMAQHHHVPTRLLDWTKSPYVAIYFAVASALSNFDSSRKDAEIAVWVLNSKQAKDKKYSHLFRVVKTPGSVSRHLSAQSGLFTVHMHNGKCKGPYTVQGIEEMVDIDEQPILKKVTIPISQAFILYKFCKQIGINAATIFPSADGAGKAVRDDFNYRKASEQFLSI